MQIAAQQRRLAAACLASALCAAPPGHADEVADFYRGRNLTIVVSSEVGTGHDAYGRTLAHHIGRHIPGNPNIVVQNMVGASGLLATNWLHNAAPRDGSVIQTFVHNIPFEPMMGNSAAKFETDKFTWIGNMASMDGVCGTSRTSGIEKFQDLFEKEAVFAGTGVTGPIASATRAVKNLLGVKIKLVTGYKGTGGIKLALQSGEVAGICSMDMSSVRATWNDLYEAGIFRPILQVSGKARSDLAGVPSITEFVKSEEDRRVIDLVLGTGILDRPFASTPGVPPERAKALRDAFMATMQDPDFLAEAHSRRLEITPMSGDQVSAFVAKITASPPDVIERARQAVRNN